LIKGLIKDLIKDYDYLYIARLIVGGSKRLKFMVLLCFLVDYLCDSRLESYIGVTFMSEITDKIAKVLEPLEGVAAVILFGSQALGHSKQDSDVDVAMLFEHDHLPSAMNLLEIRNQLEESLNNEVDLVCLNTSSPIIGMQVYKYGQPIMILNSKAYDRYLIRLFTDYSDLKYLRKEAENTILQRKYYG